ncbi:hypothetical protein DJ71_26765, partial [Halorubrum sp. E3]
MNTAESWERFERGGLDGTVQRSRNGTRHFRREPDAPGMETPRVVRENLGYALLGGPALAAEE